MQEIVNVMTSLGWHEVLGKVQHQEFGAYDSWTDAIIACVRVACEE